MNARIATIVIASLLLGSTAAAFANDQQPAMTAEHHAQKHAVHRDHAKPAHHHAKHRATHDMNKSVSK